MVRLAGGVFAHSGSLAAIQEAPPPVPGGGGASAAREHLAAGGGDHRAHLPSFTYRGASAPAVS
jgi:hypothetical protein